MRTRFFGPPDPRVHSPSRTVLAPFREQIVFALRADCHNFVSVNGNGLCPVHVGEAARIQVQVSKLEPELCQDRESAGKVTAVSRGRFAQIIRRNLRRPLSHFQVDVSFQNIFTPSRFSQVEKSFCQCDRTRRERCIFGTRSCADNRCLIGPVRLPTRINL